MRATYLCMLVVTTALKLGQSGSEEGTGTAAMECEFPEGLPVQEQIWRKLLIKQVKVRCKKMNSSAIRPPKEIPNFPIRPKTILWMQNAKLVFLLFCLILNLFILYPVHCQAGWNEASEKAADLLIKKFTFDDMDSSFRLNFSYDSTDPANKAMAEVLRDRGVLLGHRGPFKLILSHPPIQYNSWWERPYTRYVVNFRIMRERQEKRKKEQTSSLYFSGQGEHTEFLPAHFQWPARIFLFLLLGFIIRWLIRIASLYRNHLAWGIGGFVWLMFAVFLIVGMYPNLI